MNPDGWVIPAYSDRTLRMIKLGHLTRGFGTIFQSQKSMAEARRNVQRVSSDRIELRSLPVAERCLQMNGLPVSIHEIVEGDDLMPVADEQTDGMFQTGQRGGCR